MLHLLGPAVSALQPQPGHLQAWLVFTQHDIAPLFLAEVTKQTKCAPPGLQVLRDRDSQSHGVQRGFFTHLRLSIKKERKKTLTTDPKPCRPQKFLAMEQNAEPEPGVSLAGLIPRSLFDVETILRWPFCQS